MAGALGLAGSSSRRHRSGGGGTGAAAAAADVEDELAGNSRGLAGSSRWAGRKQQTP